ncbi:hypothetical protein H3997_11315 [Staphylococcus epidermidis]|uniref:hypothetical protein n=1 Tax=Staphylococcus epidermidis TaxID=1282 RepID=UPI000F3BE148|nr:hypothetical protein [Staphylococcus epidermidis]MBF2142317.1 hypothetical protein [Staphylococcus epidermidis]MCG2134977.1 hypothetical protein [Staphylococcus epidermidis]RNG65098.1 hypothetical protein D1G04_13635 [Staphylococcus aureus]RQN00820.1 hypothetical protein CPA43_01265 [Staphylococcus warneri]
MLLDIVIDSDSIIWLFLKIFKWIVIFTLIEIPMFGFYRAFINFTEHRDVNMAKRLGIMATILIVMYIAFWCLVKYLLDFDILNWLLH